MLAKQNYSQEPVLKSTANDLLSSVTALLEPRVCLQRSPARWLQCRCTTVAPARVPVARRSVWQSVPQGHTSYYWTELNMRRTGNI